MTPRYRWYFSLVGLFALWVGLWGYVLPAEVGRALPWPVPPLHARFVAAMYLAGAVAMGASLAARGLAQVRIPIALAVLWTGGLMAVSIANLSAFDFAKPQVWFWMGAYAVYPVWGAWLYLGADGAGRTATAARRADPALLAVAAVCLLVAVALVAATDTMVRAWPWKLPPLLARIYAAPFLAYGVCAGLLAREARADARRIVLASLACFCALALAASGLHRALFRVDATATWVWVGVLAAVGSVAAARWRAGAG